MPRHDFQIPVTFKHRVIFTRDAFHPDNPHLGDLLRESGGRRALIVLERAVARAWPDLATQARAQVLAAGVECPEALVFEGGEHAKSDDSLVHAVWRALDRAGIDRHSHLLSIGGGAFLDATGFAAATAHRGVRLIRFPTTTLSQDDSGVGVKCAINHFGRKNWVGSFAVPFAVINDFRFLHSQDEGTRRAGLVEAVKVAIVKDADFFRWIEQNLSALARLEPEAVETCVERSALLHARHIAEGGDPFECGSSRPLDFGHWAAHKLETLSRHECSHAHAVAIGIALDSLYARESGHLPAAEAERILHMLQGLELPIHHPLLETPGTAGTLALLDGLDEFREHLGGALTILLPTAPGRCVEVHQIDADRVASCIRQLAARQEPVHA